MVIQQQQPQVIMMQQQQQQPQMMVRWHPQLSMSPLSCPPSRELSLSAPRAPIPKLRLKHSHLVFPLPRTLPSTQMMAPQAQRPMMMGGMGGMGGMGMMAPSGGMMQNQQQFARPGPASMTGAGGGMGTAGTVAAVAGGVALGAGGMYLYENPEARGAIAGGLEDVGGGIMSGGEYVGDAMYDGGSAIVNEIESIF